MKAAMLICIALASASFAVAQTPPTDSTAPSSASSPHQRESTSTTTKETATPSNPSPSAAATPHQQQVTEGADKSKTKQDKAMHDKMMKDCVAKQQSTNSSMSQDDAKKTCTEQMKTKMRTE